MLVCSVKTCILYVPVSYDKRGNTKRVEPARNERYRHNQRRNCSWDLHYLSAVVYKPQCNKLYAPSNEVQEAWVGNGALVVAHGEAHNRGGDEVHSHVVAVVEEEIMDVLPEIL